jgi:hypothetical protein
MADIPIEKKSNMKWLWIALAVLLLVLVAWWILDDDDGDIVEYTDNDAVATQTMEDETSLAGAEVAAASVAAMAIGDDVNLEQVRVTELSGDMAFHVDANGEDMLVMFDQTKTPNTAKEGKYDINVGSLVNLEGKVMSSSADKPSGVVGDIPAGTERYIYATNIEMVS